ncbi:MAG: DUF5618 family protein [Nitrospirota bacterium]
MKESLRYLNNAKEILKSVPVEDNTYTDIKPVREACGTAYLAVLMAIDEYLVKIGIEQDKLPTSVDGYRKALRKYVSVHDGKLLKSFEALYNELHIAGHYRGLLRGVGVVKEVLKDAKAFIEKIG